MAVSFCCIVGSFHDQENKLEGDKGRISAGRYDFFLYFLYGFAVGTFCEQIYGVLFCVVMSNDQCMYSEGNGTGRC